MHTQVRYLDLHGGAGQPHHQPGGRGELLLPGAVSTHTVNWVDIYLAVRLVLDSEYLL